MFNSLQSHLQWRNDLLLAGRYGDLAQTYVLPQVVYFGDDILNLTDLAATIGFLQRFHGDLMQRDVRSCCVRVIAVGLPVRGRFKVWATLRYITPTCEALTEAVYYMVETAQGLRSEMMEFAECGLPMVQALRQANSILL